MAMTAAKWLKETDPEVLLAYLLERQPSENWSDWLARVQRHQTGVAQLDRLIRLHHRHRFDPQGLTTQERAELRSAVQSWLSLAPARR